MIVGIGIGVAVIVLPITWCLMRSAAKADRQLEELFRRKFLEEGGDLGV